eukprot:CAMPEP_0173296436 /NCGR_PEP_ID=MMETSP1143-20121109/14953_1 /TAXON_ID=483371 /ORGANISM="non described non described, Strain CCMP2298" /LENGTH=86 /DNA_ID=CAMNT_0014236275 /DNA_START=334 /DNA_END=594 /DNA_ORIENTATION=-
MSLPLCLFPTASASPPPPAVPLGLRLSVGGDTMEEIMVGTEGVETEGGAKSDRSDGLGAFRANARVGVGAWVRLGAVCDSWEAREP